MAVQGLIGPMSYAMQHPSMLLQYIMPATIILQCQLLGTLLLTNYSIATGRQSSERFGLPKQAIVLPRASANGMGIGTFSSSYGPV